MIGLLNTADALFREDPIAGGLVALVVILAFAVLFKITVDGLKGGGQ